ncbi:hypothetical protein [Streptomyces sp. 1331.2]|uniref:hypothetical protein n=1 Tax=Streptomyces sp. 1331.2 TaxID=1938835 RepID=UPI000BD77210|nr:hypothetical protein [Streptomyces sp. 1331.2]SOB81267.1 hypothetical protein SAMN06272789_1393 [Streptomyces sp. 1331.2]
MNTLPTIRTVTGNAALGTAATDLVIEDLDTVAPQGVALFTVCVMSAQPAPTSTTGGQLGA